VEKKELYSREKEKYYNRKEWGLVAIEDMRNNDIDIENKIIERKKDIQKQTEECKIRDAKYNNKYKEIGAKIDLVIYRVKI